MKNLLYLNAWYKHAALICIFFILTHHELQSQTFPPGFNTVAVASGMTKPVAMTFAPDGRIFVAEQGGWVRVIKNGALLSTPLVQLRVSLRGEGGLVGIIVDPDFSTNQYLYVYYTVPGGARNRISRFKCEGDIAPLSSEKIILDLDTLTATIHNGGAMRFHNGKLYVSIGDNSNEANAPNLDTYHGKVIRINPDGSIPAGNPFTLGSAQRRRVWSYGLRNPFTFDIQQGTGKILVNDVGFNLWEEINDATSGGQNYGWPDAEGNSTNPAYTNPVYAYPHGRNDEFGCAITGGTFFNPVQSNYPSQYTGRYFFQDYCGQWIRTLAFSGTSATVENFGSGIGIDALYLTTGNDGNLYYILRSTGTIYKIVYSTNEAPAILKHPVSLSVSQGQPASFSVSASGKAPLTYQWQKNGANITGATASTYAIAQTTSADAASYRVKVTNSLGSVTSNAATLTVTGSNSNPVAQISTPVAGALYRAGDVISFSGSANDAEDGELAASQFTWLVDFHHDTHHHDSPPVATGVKSGTYTIPVRGETSDNVWYRISLIVTDSKGAKDTVSRDVYPRKSTITLTTQPAGLKVKLDGQTMNTPLSVVSVEGLERSIGVVTPQTLSGKNYGFDVWLHGGAETQTISTPLDDKTYTAVFKEIASDNLIQREVWTGIPGMEVSAIPVNATPSSISDLPSFESPVNTGTDYGCRIRGYIIPPATGSYVFWIASDDKSELWLSTNDLPTNKKKIASVTGFTGYRQWTKYTTQKSVAISLSGGQRYYIEALHKEASGGDHLSVGWQLPNGTQERPIPGNRLARFQSQNIPPVVSISSPANDQAFMTPASISIAVNASDADGITKIEFYNGMQKLGEDITTPYTFSWENVSAGQYTVTAKAIDTKGASSSASVSFTVKGMIQRENWTGITGSDVTAIPFTTSPTSVINLTLLEGPMNAGSDYGSRIRGYVHPPSTGTYVFWISSDDRSELWLSTSDNTTQKVKIAYVNGYTESRQWDKYLTQQSSAISLTSGKKYYIEILHKEAAGRDHVAVGWKLPNGALERPVPGSRISPYMNASSNMRMASVLESEELLMNESHSEINSISVVPNPITKGSHVFTLEVNESFKDAHEVVVQIINIAGQKIYQEKLMCSETCESLEIHLKQPLPAGVYAVTAIVQQKRFVSRMVVR